MNSRFAHRFILIMISVSMLCLATSSGLAQTGSTLYSFTNSGGDGADPFAGLVMDSAGNFYGATIAGGSSNMGTIFELVNSSGNYSERVLYSFKGGTDGASPNGNVILDSAGNLYGTTPNGGASSAGTVFELVNSSGNYSENILYSFKGSFSGGDGANPDAGLIMDSAGNLYGTTANGGSSFGGTVFELVNSSGSYSESVLYSFTDKSDGGGPIGGLIMDSAGNLYGTTFNGGSSFLGTVYELVNSSGSYSESVLYNFTGKSDGGNPDAGLIMDSAGNLYGTTSNGGASSFGTVFELVNSSGSYSESVLYSFMGNSDGADPYAGLIMDSAGNLYGTTVSGGSSNTGTVFKLVNSSGAYSEQVLFSFGGTCGFGSNPYGKLTIDSSGNLYGTTYLGGSNNYGTVFKINILSGTNTTTTTPSSSPNPATPGMRLQLTATVTSSVGTITTGTVTFSASGVTLGTAPVICGSAPIIVDDADSLGIGTYAVSAQYTPSLSVFAPSSGSFNQTVNEAGVVLTNGDNTLTGTETVNGSVDATTFAGNGAALTNVSAAGINCTGCVGNAQLGINYAGSSSQGGAASNALLFGGLLPSAFQPAGSYATLGANLFGGAQSITGNLSVTGNASTTGTTTLGATGTPIVEHFSKVFTPTFALGSGQACTSQVFAFTGASNGDTVALGVPNQRMSVGDVIYTAWVSAANRVTIKVCAFATKPANLGTGSVRVDVWKH